MWEKAKLLSRTFSPGLYRGAQRIRDQVSIEYRVLRQIGLKGLIQPAIESTSDWQQSLPVQRPRRVRVPLAAAPGTDARSLPDFQHGAAGAHAVYLAPEQFQSGSLVELARNYPPNAGIKVVRNPGDVATGSYVSGAAHSQLQRSLLPGHGHLMLAASRMCAAGVGPRVYDLLELDAGGAIYTAYVVEHCPGQATESQSRQLIAELRQLVDGGELGLVIPDGFQHADFSAPAYGNNIHCTAAGKPVYVDFQNFRVERYSAYLRTIASAAAEATHFGDRSILRGGRYLYQSVPGVGRGKRDVGARMATIDRLLAEAGLSLDGRLVFDFGCNIGMMLAEYLRRGARWAHGWDLATTTPHTDRLLQGIGCTRFSLSSRKMEPASPVEQDIPDWLRPQLDGLVVSYLAVNAHFGWLEALGRLPWSFLIYEGHEAEDAEDGREARQVMASLAGARSVAAAHYRDGDSRPRYVAVFAR